MTPKPSTSPRLRLWIAIVLLAAVTFLLHARAIGFGFCVYDDQHQIVHNPVLTWSAAPSYFVKDVWGFAQPQYRKYYRPLFLLWLLVNRTLFGPQAALWHVALLALHATVVAQVFLLGRRLLKEDWLAAIAAALFAVHPAHVESVAWLSGVTEPLVAVLFLGGFLLYLRWRESLSLATMLGCAALTLCALLAKETALALPVLIALYEALFPRATNAGGNRWVGAARAAWLPLLMVPIYLAARVHAMQHVMVGTNSAALVLLTWPLLLTKYVAMMVWPSGLALFHAEKLLAGPSLTGFVLPLLLVLALAGAVAWWRSAMGSFLALWFVLPLAPVLVGAFSFPPADLLHDRYTYVSSVGAALLVAYLLGRIPRGIRLLNMPVGVVLAIVPICLLATTSLVQVEWWQNGLALFTRAVDVAPENVSARNLLANQLYKAGAADRALELYQGTLQLDPNLWETNFAAGVTYYAVGQRALAELLLRRACELDRTNAVGYLFLSDVLREQGRVDEARKVLRDGLTAVDSQQELLRQKLATFAAQP